MHVISLFMTSLNDHNYTRCYFHVKYFYPYDKFVLLWFWKSTKSYTTKMFQYDVEPFDNCVHYWTCTVKTKHLICMVCRYQIHTFNFASIIIILPVFIVLFEYLFCILHLYVYQFWNVIIKKRLFCALMLISEYIGYIN